MPFYEHFSLIQPSRPGERIASREADAILKRMLRIKKDIHSLLEIGPGRGPFYQSCRRGSIDYTCVDISWSLLTGLGDGKRVHGSATILPFKLGSFDAAFASNVLEHMVDYRAAFEFLKEMTRTVKEGSLVCHRVPNAMAWGMHFWNGDYSHSFPTTPRNLSQLFLDLGLAIEGVYPVAGPAVGGWAPVLGWLGKLIPSWVVGQGANPLSRVSKFIYSAKTTFLPGFLIVGRKTS